MRTIAKKGQRGFTLIELVVVIAILGVLAAVSVPLVTGYLSQAKERAYDNDVKQVQAAVDAYYSAPDNTKFIGKRQYPIYGATKASSTTGLVTTNADIVTATSVLQATSPKDPLGGTVGGNPKWTDGTSGDGIRSTSEEVLRATTATTAGWYLVAVTRQGATYYVDTRDYIIDMDKLTAAGLLGEAPTSAGDDNCPTTTCTGSYTYYVDADGKVKTLKASFPVATSTGFKDVHP
ncbi:MAG: prepilin-type N-terminal cleavage/methylation domain-containing protein [Chloroflexi bacterium]|nr:prepilin-type N-terminal cleavage/methylation domain-containing protein [Chloroflexota bacterium]